MYLSPPNCSDLLCFKISNAVCLRWTLFLIISGAIYSTAVTKDDARRLALGRLVEDANDFFAVPLLDGDFSDWLLWRSAIVKFGRESPMMSVAEWDVAHAVHTRTSRRENLAAATRIRLSRQSDYRYPIQEPSSSCLIPHGCNKS